MRTSRYRIVNADTGEWTVDFYDGDRLCEAAEVDLQKSHIAKQYASYGLIAADLELLKKWAASYLESVTAFEGKLLGQMVVGKNVQIPREDSATGHELFTLFTAICIIYGRLFTQHSSGMPSLEKKAHVAPRHHQIHEELMNARHRYIAHRNNKGYEGIKTFVVKNPDDPNQFMVVYQSNTVAFNASPVIRDIIENLDALSKCIKAKIEKLREKLEEEHKLKPLPVAPTSKRGRT